MLLYYITDRRQFPGKEDQRRRGLLERISQAARAGIDYVQLREKDLPARELELLATEAAHVLHESRTSTRLLINSRTDVALAAGADGVHLTSTDISPVDVRKIWKLSGASRQPIVAVSCHSESEVVVAQNAGADFVVFGPVFEKSGSAEPARGTARLRAVCQHRIPVLALGGINLANARDCENAGAKGIAGIRLFQAGDLNTTVSALRKLG
ncbi:MAG TPA: thiamine phosphate synthase [Terriglobales bacterium]|nr:thiamine phosphate synthase [Terriglobales bacterium]